MIGLRWWRRARGLTQAELAMLSGVEQSHLSKIERGEVYEPRPDTLRRLAGALGVEPFDLYLGQFAFYYFGAPEGLRRETWRDPRHIPSQDDSPSEAPAGHPTNATHIGAGGSLE